MTSTKRLFTPAIVLSIALMTLSSCVCPPSCSNLSATGSRVRTEIYFGLSQPDGTSVSAEQWTAFLRDKVTPEFPDGLTVLDAHGQWRNADGAIVREPSRIVVLFHTGDANSDAAIERIRKSYIKQFDQESVLRVDSSGQVDF